MYMLKQGLYHPQNWKNNMPKYKKKKLNTNEFNVIINAGYNKRFIIVINIIQF